MNTSCMRHRCQNADYWLCRRLSMRHYRPNRRAAEPRDERAPFHSITSSARASNDGGTSIPSALAVLRLIASLIFGRVPAPAGRQAFRP